MIRFIDEHKDRRSGTLVWGIEPNRQDSWYRPFHLSRLQDPTAVGEGGP